MTAEEHNAFPHGRWCTPISREGPGTSVGAPIKKQAVGRPALCVRSSASPLISDPATSAGPHGAAESALLPGGQGGAAIPDEEDYL